MRRYLSAAVLAGCLLGTALPVSAHAESVRQEAAGHPRIARAIHEMEDAIRYMEAAPHDFGGHKAQAIAATREAVTQLREALRFRAVKDTRAGR